MNRREFLRQVGLVSVGLAVASPEVLRLAPRALAAEQPKPVVSVAEGKDYVALVSSVLAPLGGMAAFVKPGNRVVVKPNIGWDRKPELAATTHPDVVKALVQLALGAGAARVLVFDRPCNEERRCYTNSGIQAAVQSLNDDRAMCVFMDERKFTPVDMPNAKSLKQFTFYQDALEADCYINAPVAKHHGSSGLTLSLKNTMGVIGGSRGHIHMGLDQRIADLNTVIKSHLVVIDATRILLRNGPSGGNPKDVKVLDTLIASADPVAADAYATTLFGMKPEDLGSTVAAYDLGLGEMDLSKVQVIKNAMA